MRISGIGLIQKDPSSKDVILSAKMAESRDVRIAVQWIIGTTIALIETQMAVKLRISWKVSTLWKQGAIRALLYSYNRSDVVPSPKNRGILDTACTSSVCDDPWISRFIGTLPETARKMVKKIDTQTKFVFGDGKSSWAKYKIRLPVEICTVRCFIAVDVIDGNLPLLFSKTPWNVWKLLSTPLTLQLLFLTRKLQMRW